MKGKLTVLPANSVKPVATLPTGENKLSILSIESDGGSKFYVQVKFPDEFDRTFQIQTVEQLASRCGDILKSRYGVEQVEFVSIPKELKADEYLIINIKEINNG